MSPGPAHRAHLCLPTCSLWDSGSAAEASPVRGSDDGCFSRAGHFQVLGVCVSEKPRMILTLIFAGQVFAAACFLNSGLSESPCNMRI